jgi:hypothetical protein
MHLGGASAARRRGLVYQRATAKLWISAIYSIKNKDLKVFRSD